MKNWTGRLLWGEAGQEIMHPLADLGRREGNEVTPNARRRSRGRGATSVNRKEKLRLQWHQVIPLSKEYGRHGRQRNLEELKTGQKTGV